MYTNKKLERKKLDRLKKYKEFLQSDYGGGYWAGDLYSIIDKDNLICIAGSSQVSYIK